MSYQPTIGLEVHLQLNTANKLFTYARTSFGDTPNTNISPLCLALPGSLPVLNKDALKKAILAALAVKATIHKISKFDRKNYYYPDLPKGYQISQFYEPYCTKGELTIEFKSGATKKIRITRIHLEEDAGKLIHAEDDSAMQESYVDLNRAGTPLIEIVSEPEISSSEEAYLYLNELKKNMEYLQISDCNMEQGSLRCDANISVKPKDVKELGTRVEIKNLNTFKGVRAAIDHEIERQIDLINSGEKVIQETRLWNASLGETSSMRGKEEAHDYRYFPDPDLGSVILTQTEIDKIATELPELPQIRKKRFINEYKLPSYDAQILTGKRSNADYFEKTVQYGANPKKVSNWLMVEMMAVTNEKKCSLNQLCTPNALSELLKLIDSGKISGKIAKGVFQEMMQTKALPQKIIEDKNLIQISNESVILPMVLKTLTENQNSVESFKAGKERALGYLVGQIMKQSKGKANPSLVNTLLLRELKKI